MMEIFDIPPDQIGMEEVLRFIEQAREVDDPSSVNLDLTLSQLKSMVEVGDKCREELRLTRTAGMSKYAVGDIVRDKLSGKEFTISLGHTGPHPDPEIKKFVWWYSYGFYFISEGDLELVQPRAKLENNFGRNVVGDRRPARG